MTTDCCFISQVYYLLEKATQNRAVAATQCNERSSRSHSVFRLKLVGENQMTGEKCQGMEACVCCSLVIYVRNTFLFLPSGESSQRLRKRHGNFLRFGVKAMRKLKPSVFYRAQNASLPAWGPFLESPGNFSGPELYFRIQIYKTLS